jgi:hypothetical protein
MKGDVAMMPKTVLAFVLGAGAASWLGCAASIPPPQGPWAAAQADVGRAEVGGALDVPEAKLHLRLAQENLEKAKRIMGDDTDRATSLCDVASAEAQLALTLAKQANAQEQARRAQSQLENGSGK